jgi:hypothetical protein
MMREVEKSRICGVEDCGLRRPVPHMHLKKKVLSLGCVLRGLFAVKIELLACRVRSGKATRSWGWVFNEAVYALSLGQVV